MVLVAGVSISSAESWLLAKLLHEAGRTELTVLVGCVVDAAHPEDVFTWGDHVEMLLILERDCPDDLLWLREALWIAVTHPPRGLRLRVRRLRLSR